MGLAVGLLSLLSVSVSFVCLCPPSCPYCCPPLSFLTSFHLSRSFRPSLSLDSSIPYPTTVQVSFLFFSENERILFQEEAHREMMMERGQVWCSLCLSPSVCSLSYRLCVSSSLSPSLLVCLCHMSVVCVLSQSLCISPSLSLSCLCHIFHVCPLSISISLCLSFSRCVSPILVVSLVLWCLGETNGGVSGTLVTSAAKGNSFKSLWLLLRCLIRHTKSLPLPQIHHNILRWRLLYSFLREEWKIITSILFSHSSHAGSVKFSCFLCCSYQTQFTTVTSFIIWCNGFHEIGIINSLLTLRARGCSHVAIRRQKHLQFIPFHFDSSRALLLLLSLSPGVSGVSGVPGVPRNRNVFGSRIELGIIEMIGRQPNFSDIIVTFFFRQWHFIYTYLYFYCKCEILALEFLLRGREGVVGEKMSGGDIFDTSKITWFFRSRRSLISPVFSLFSPLYQPAMAFFLSLCCTFSFSVFWYNLRSGGSGSGNTFIMTLLSSSRGGSGSGLACSQKELKVSLFLSQHFSTLFNTKHKKKTRSSKGADRLTKNFFWSTLKKWKNEGEKKIVIPSSHINSSFLCLFSFSKGAFRVWWCMETDFLEGIEINTFFLWLRNAFFLSLIMDQNLISRRTNWNLQLTNDDCNWLLFSLTIFFITKWRWQI
jgi:hypothetical protein